MDSNQKRRFKTVIGGEDYILVGKNTEEHMQAVSDLLNKQLDQLKTTMPAATNEQLAILIAFNALSAQLTNKEQSITNDEDLKD